MHLPKKATVAVAAAISTGAMFLLSGTAFADTVSVNFENPPYTIGNINGQNGWSNTGMYDANVVASSVANFGTQSLQISDAKTSGSFGDQVFSPSLTNEAGEAVAESGSMSGGVRQPHFEAQFDLASIMPSLQAGMHMSVSPDRGDGARMSYLRFEDQADGIHVFFDDVTDPSGVVNADTFNETDIATLSRTAHTIKFVMDFVAGPHNDVVKIYIDGALVHTGTSWEDYYRFDTESNPSAPSDTSRTVDSLLFRESGTTNVADSGKGFLIDGLTLMSGATPSGSVIVVTPSNTQGWSTADTRPGGAVNFITDGTTPSGIGALQLTTDNSTTAKAQYMHDAGSMPLTSVTELSYYTKQNSASFSGGDASYQLPVFLQGAGIGFTTFVFEPYENGTVTPDVWQQWDVAKGQFWSSKTVECENGTITAGGGGVPFYTLAQIENICPNAVVAGFGVNIGSYNPSYDVETDLVSFNNTAYDFEPYLPTANSKEACMNNGWKMLTDGTNHFKNQGDCVSFVATKGKNKAAGN